MMASDAGQPMPARAGERHAGPVRVLVVDSKASSRERIVALLERCAYQVCAVKTSKEAHDEMERAAGGGNDACVYDWVLSSHEPPSSSSLHLLRRLKADERFKEVPVVVASSVEDNDTLVQCLQLGAADYLMKPLRSKDLRNIWTRLRWREQAPGAASMGTENAAAASAPRHAPSCSSETQADSDAKSEGDNPPTSKEGSAPDDQPNGRNGTSKTREKADRIGDHSGNAGSGNGSGEMGGSGNGTGNGVGESATKHDSGNRNGPGNHGNPGSNNAQLTNGNGNGNGSGSGGEGKPGNGHVGASTTLPHAEGCALMHTAEGLLQDARHSRPIVVGAAAAAQPAPPQPLQLPKPQDADAKHDNTEPVGAAAAAPRGAGGSGSGNGGSGGTRENEEQQEGKCAPEPPVQAAPRREGSRPHRHHPTPPGPPRRPRQEAKSVQEAGGVPPAATGAARDLAGGGAGGEQPAAGGAEPARAADANGAAAYGGRPGDAPASVPAGAAAMGSGVQQLWQQQAREALQHLRSVLEMASTSTMGMQLAQGLASLIGSQMAASMCPRSSAAHPPPANPAVSGPPASPATASGSQVRTQTYGAPAWPGARYQGTAAAAAPPQLQQPSRAGHQPQHRLPAASGGPWFSQKQALENLSMAVRSSLANATSGGAAGAARVPAPAYSTPTPAYSAPAPQPMQQVANPLWSALAQVQQAMLQRGPQAGVPAVSMPASQPPTTAMWGAQPLLNPAAIAALQQQLPAAGAALHAGAMHPGGGVPSSVPGAQAARQPPMSQPPAGDAQPLQPPASGEPRANPLPPPPSWGAPATQRDACATFEPNGGPAGGRKGAATETARRGPRTRGGNPPSSGRAGQTEANGSASGSDECMEDDDSKGLQSSSSLRVRSETRHTLPPSSGAAPAAGGTEPGGRQRALKKAATGPPEGATRSAKRQKAGADGRRGGRNRGSDSGSNSPPGGRAAGDATGESPERVEEDSLTSGKGAT